MKLAEQLFDGVYLLQGVSIELMPELGAKLGAWPRSVDSQLRFAFGGHLRDLTNQELIRERNQTRPFRYTILPSSMPNEDRKKSS
ncbi:MAG: hypothetical protein HY360_25790 [Verrucomicrobia bacterium]|nr:hypothetical protein [Verrucomicrobiota bacterium]